MRTLLLSLAPAVLALGLAPAALAQQLLYIHTDHLNTPRMVTDGTGTAVWRWDQAEPFGDNPPDEDPDGNGGLGHMPLRFPGQYFDKETQTSYNYFRDYDPGTGRYIQSDPIGLRGGLNTYSYALQNPLSHIDPTGEAAAGAAVVGGVAIACLRFPQLCATGIRVVGGAIGAAVGYALKEKECPPSENNDPKDCSKVRQMCIEGCSKYLPSPSGDLQASEFHKCVSDCLYDNGC